MTKKLLTVALTIAACAALCGAVCPRNASDEKVPEAKQTPIAAAVAQTECAATNSHFDHAFDQTQKKEKDPLYPINESESEPVAAAGQPPTASQKTTEAPEAKPAQAPTAAPQPAPTSQPEQPQPSANPTPGERSVAGGKAQIWVPGFGWVVDGGGNVCTYAENLYENGNKIGSMG